MDRLEGVLARAQLPAVFFADFKVMLSFSEFIEDVGGAGGASTSPTSTIELQIDGWDDSINGAYTGEGVDSKVWHGLLEGAGGHQSVVQSFKQAPKATVNNPESLMLWLAKYFGIIDDSNMFMVLTVAYFNISGGPTVEMETDMFGGLHYLHGTHMRGWSFVYHLLKHPLCLNTGVTCTVAMAKAMTLVAFLTCGPAVWRRICRNVRAEASLTLLVLSMSLQLTPACSCACMRLHRHERCYKQMGLCLSSVHFMERNTFQSLADLLLERVMQTTPPTTTSKLQPETLQNTTYVGMDSMVRPFKVCTPSKRPSRSSSPMNYLFA
jgi:hypothetical protein